MSGSSHPTGSVLTSILALMFFFADADAQERATPNVLILMADDLGYGDVGCYGSEIRTPHIDRLAREGLRFTDFYSAAPNCSPSRAGLLTGRTPSRIGVYDYIDPGSPMHLPDTEVTLAELLKSSGYDTCHVGKWHLSAWEREPDAPLRSPTPGDQGFDHWFATDNNAIPSHRNPENFLRNNEPLGVQEGFACQLVADEAIGWLHGRADRSAPFFLNVWFNEPHKKIASPDELIVSYEGVDAATAEYFANVTNMDAAVGRILSTLDDLGLRDETFVLFMSDNGPWRDGSSGPLRAKKSSLYEGGIRVPGIIRWPGTIQPERQTAVPAGAVDIVPTLADIIRLPLPADVVYDGESMLPLLQGKAFERDRPLFWLFYKSTPMCALRVGEYSLLGNPAVSYRSDSHPFDQTDFDYVKRATMEVFELYDLDADVAQQHDLAEDLPDVVNRLSTKMRSIHRDVVAQGVRWSGLRPE